MHNVFRTFSENSQSFLALIVRNRRGNCKRSRSDCDCTSIKVTVTTGAVAQIERSGASSAQSIHQILGCVLSRRRRVFVRSAQIVCVCWSTPPPKIADEDIEAGGMEEAANSPACKPFKICDSSRETRKGVVASSLEDLTSKVLEKLNVTGKVTVVLEVDGTEIDDEEYFATLEPHTGLMILSEEHEQKWLPPGPPCRISADQVDDANGGAELAGLVGKLKHNLCHVSLLGGAELELLSDMDPDSLVDITFPDKIFLEQLKEASGRFLSEKRQAQDAMDLLQLYREKEADTGETK